MVHSIRHVQCEECNQWFMHPDNGKRGRSPKYCDKCRKKVRSKQNALRVAKHRDKKTELQLPVTESAVIQALRESLERRRKMLASEKSPAIRAMHQAAIDEIEAALR